MQSRSVCVMTRSQTAVAMVVASWVMLWWTVVSNLGVVSGARQVSAWLCLENCNENMSVNERLMKHHSPPAIYHMHDLHPHDHNTPTEHFVGDDGKPIPPAPSPSPHSPTHGEDPAIGHAHSHILAPAHSTVHNTHSELDSLSTAIYAAYSVGSSAQLLWMNFTDVSKIVKSYGLNSIVCVCVDLI